MNEKLTVQDLISLLARKHGLSTENADAFVREFFSLIEQGLEADKYVKVKGLGTFKLVDVESRESVNVNTGERFKIEGHTKVSFTPDSSLRDLINKPFAHFETVILNENTVLEDTLVENAEDCSEGEELKVAAFTDTEKEQTVVETDAITPEIVKSVVEEKPEPIAEETIKSANGEKTYPAEEDVTEGISENIKPEEDKTEFVGEELDELANGVNQENISSRFVENTDIQSDLKKSSVEKKLSADEIISREIRNVDSEYKSTHNNLSTSKTKFTAKQENVSVVEKNKAIPYIIGLIMVVLLGCGWVIVSLYYPDLFTSVPKEKLDVPREIICEDSQPKVALDSINRHNSNIVKEIPANEDNEKVVENIKPKTAEVLEKNEVKEFKEKKESVTLNPKTASKQAVPIKPDSMSYIIKGTKTTYTIKEGETLTRVSLRFYRTKALWPYIVKHNKNVIKNPDNVPYGTTLKIPELVKK